MSPPWYERGRARWWIAVIPPRGSTRLPEPGHTNAPVDLLEVTCPQVRDSGLPTPGRR